MLILNAAEVRRALPMKDAVEAMKQATASFSSGRSLVQPRIHLSIANHFGTTLVMPSFVEVNQLADQALATKVVSLFDGNPARGLACIQAAVLVLKPDTGEPIALLEGATLTAIRTAAASGAATDLLARRDCRTLGLLGAGVQARAHCLAVCAVRPIDTVLIFSRSPGKVAALIAELAAHPDVRAKLMAVDSSRQALAEADIVCATTTSREPIMADADLKPGVHI